MPESLEANHSAPKSQELVEQRSDMKKVGPDRVNAFSVLEALGVSLDWENRMRIGGGRVNTRTAVRLLRRAFVVELEVDT